ncbi:MAG: tripartite tricarboxylate transporter substrate binding protein [Pigmentiphaga sp.]|nr:tripartite tricarboxylate transporter substrate binding protein [Pigmentiphaga sp.]
MITTVLRLLPHKCIASTALMLATLGCSFPALSAYPDRPITWVVGFPPGGGTDFMARTIGAQLAEELKQPVIIENRPGAGGNVAAESVSRRAADGYVIMSAERTLLSYSKSLFKNLTFDPYQDFQPVSLMTKSPFLLVVRTEHPAQSLQDFISTAQAKPGAVSYASPGPGTPHHIATEAFSQAAGVQMLHVPYRGAAPAVADLLGGQVEMMVLDLQLAQPLLRGHKIRALAVMAPERLKQAEWQEIPSTTDAGLTMPDTTTWQGVVVPATTPDAIVVRLSEALRAAIESNAVQQSLIEAGLIPTPSTPGAMSELIRHDAETWGDYVEQLNLVLD